MRSRDATPIDPEAAAALAAIDAALAGEPVAPRHAELAELALLLAAERPEPDRSFTTLLDERAARRFAPGAPGRRGSPRRFGRWLVPAGGLATAAVAAIVIATEGSRAPGVLASHSPTRLPPTAGRPPAAGSPSPAVPAARAPSLAAAPPPGSSTAGSSTAAGSSSTAAGPAAATPSAATGPSATTVLQPIPDGRRIVQGAQLALTTAPARVDQVAQEVFVVVGEENGIVESSSVTQGGPDGYAQFQLSIPSPSLPQAMAALSTLRYAQVASRTDTTQDVNDQYQGDVRALADARALRTSLLKQLAAATTQAQIDSLTAQIHDAEASISSDQATLRRLDHEIAYSQVTLTINAAAIVPIPVKGSSFTLGGAAHDAGRVLTVAAGAALILAAALVPLALFAALAWWVIAALRRRRREQALDSI